MAKDRTGFKVIANNKKANHDYFIEEVFEAGIVLAGTEVKSIRQGGCSIKESFIKIKDSEAWILNMHVNPYDHGNIFNKEPLRTRKLLLHRKQIDRLIGETTQKGMTLVPMRVYIKGSLVKVEFGLARGKKLHDKRQDIAKKDVRRANEREFKIKNI